MFDPVLSRSLDAPDLGIEDCFLIGVLPGMTGVTLAAGARPPDPFMALTIISTALSCPTMLASKLLSIAVLLAGLAVLSDARAADAFSGNPSLPEPVPYLNTPESFFVGNGLAAGGGAADGTWEFLAGPDYTCPNYLDREEIHLMVDGEEHALTMKVHRARKTGVFYGIENVGDLKVCLVDYALNGEPWVARSVMVENQSRVKAHILGVIACIHPILGPGRTNWVASDSSGRARGIGMKLDTSLKCAHNWACPNWADRYALIAFADPASTAKSQVQGNHTFGRLETAIRPINPGGSRDFTLYHFTHYQDVSEADGFKLIQQRNSREDLKACIAWWQKWFDDVAPVYSLSRLKDERARNLVEGGLAVLKMNECRDGGIVANEMGWNMSYVRDAYCGLRGLGAFGHFEEAKNFIRWLDHKVAVHGLVPNAAPGGSDTYAHPNGNNGRTCAEANASVEVTALYLLAARDYYHATHDFQTLTDADSSLRYAMDAQLKLAAQNGYLLEFSGDETELCGASDVPAIKQEGFNRNLAQYWSMTSVALCAASLDFYIQYLKERGSSTTEYVNHLDHRTLNLHDELNKLQDALERDFWRTNLPECPSGFHDWFRSKSDNAWPAGRIVNFTLFPLYYGTPVKNPQELKNDVAAMKQYFTEGSRLLPVTGLPGHKSLGHDLGYLLWGLVAVGDPKKDAVYDALVNGPTACCWGAYHEAYQADGTPNANGLRSFETGVNLSAIAKYWKTGIQ